MRRCLRARFQNSFCSILQTDGKERNNKNDGTGPGSIYRKWARETSVSDSASNFLNGSHNGRTPRYHTIYFLSESAEDTKNFLAGRNENARREFDGVYFTHGTSDAGLRVGNNCLLFTAIRTFRYADHIWMRFFNRLRTKIEGKFHRSSTSTNLQRTHKGDLNNLWRKPSKLVKFLRREWTYSHTSKQLDDYD